MAEEKKNPLGPTGDYVRANIQRLREARGLNKKDLSDKVGALGRPIPPLGISRIEAGTRRVDADDLVAVALALNVAPITLLLPPTWGEAPVQLTSTEALSSRGAWRWAEGTDTASDWGAGGVTVEADEEKAEADEAAYWLAREEYLALTQPPERRRAAQHPANRASQALAKQVDRLVTLARPTRGGRRGDETEGAAQLQAVRARLAQLEAEIAQLQADAEQD